MYGQMTKLNTWQLLLGNTDAMVAADKLRYYIICNLAATTVSFEQRPSHCIPPNPIRSMHIYMDCLPGRVLAASKQLHKQSRARREHIICLYLSCSQDIRFLCSQLPVPVRPQLPTAAAEMVHLLLLSCFLSWAGGRKPQLLPVFISPHLTALTEQVYLDSEKLW